MKKGTIYVDIKKCLACRSCEIACAVEHSGSKDLYKAVNEIPLSQARVSVEGTRDFSLPLQCRHCEDAPCIKICPTNAIKKLEVEGPVIIEDELCIGCKCCILVCPFGVITLSKKGRVALKCDLCFERLKEGKLTACVDACPTKAIRLLTSDELAKEKKESLKKEIEQKISSK